MVMWLVLKQSKVMLPLAIFSQTIENRIDMEIHAKGMEILLLIYNNSTGK